MNDLVESDFVGWLNITQHRPDIVSIKRVAGWNFHREDEFYEEIILKTAVVNIKPNYYCQLHHTASLICVSIVSSCDMFDMVSSIVY